MPAHQLTGLLISLGCGLFLLACFALLRWHSKRQDTEERRRRHRIAEDARRILDDIERRR